MIPFPLNFWARVVTAIKNQDLESLLNFSEVIALNLDVTIQESLGIVDELTVNKINRIVLKAVMESLLDISESMTLDRDISISETINLLDELTVSKINRIVQKPPMESLLNLSEAITLEIAKFFDVSESINIIDELTKFSEPRAKQKSLVSILDVSEQIELTITPTAPVISGMNGYEGGACDAYCDITPGNNCLSVKAWYSINGGIYQFHSTTNTTPGIPFTVGLTSGLSLNDVVRWKGEPFNQTNGNGVQGNDAFSNFIDITSC